MQLKLDMGDNLLKKGVESSQVESKIDTIGSEVDVTIMMRHKATVNAVSITP